MTSKITIIKRKSKGFFKPDDVPIIKSVVNDVQDIITNASILVRAYYLDWFDKQDASNPQYLEVDNSLIHLATQVVQGAKELKTRNTGKKEDDDKAKKKSQNKEHFQNLLRVCNDIFGTNFKVSSEFSISHILAYSIGNLVTAYTNNIQEHFIKYPKRFIRCDLLAKGFSSKEAKTYAAIISNYFFYEEVTTKNALSKAIQTVIEAIKTKGGSLEQYMALFPKLQDNEKPRCYQITSIPWTYLFYMVKINKELETSFQTVPEKYKRLLNPLPFHSSFIPMHVRIDTSGICQLLMNKQRFQKPLFSGEKSNSKHLF